MHRPAITKWNEEYLVAATGDRPIPINATPQGAADSIIQDPESGEKVFVYPAEVNMTMRDFFSEIKCRDAQDRAVLYLSQQDNNMIKHFPELQEDIRGFLGLPEKSFGVTGPEAVNIWIGAHYFSLFSTLHWERPEFILSSVIRRRPFCIKSSQGSLRKFVCSHFWRKNIHTIPSYRCTLLARNFGAYENVCHAVVELPTTCHGPLHDLRRLSQRKVSTKSLYHT